MPISIQDLKTAAGVLRRAKGLVETVRALFCGHDTDAAARLGDIVTRLDDEREYVERLITKPTNGGANP
jgi:hypothetical protein